MKKLTRNSLAKHTNLTINTLRYYEKLRLIKPDTISENGYLYYCRSNILRLKKFMFTKKIGMKTSEGVSFFKTKNLNDSYKYLLSYENCKEKELKKLKKQLKVIKKSLALIENNNKLPFGKVLAINELYETYTNQIMKSEESVNNINSWIDISYENVMENAKDPLNIKQCFSLKINLFNRNVKITRSFFSKTIPFKESKKIKNIDKSHLIIYFESSLMSLEKNIIENYTLLRKSSLCPLSYSNFSLELVIINYLFPLDLNSKKIYALRLPIR